MPETPDSYQEHTDDTGEAPRENPMVRLYREAQQQPETGAVSPELQQQSREDLTVTFLNTSFSAAFDHPEGIDALLLSDGNPHENAVFGFSEVTHSQRGAVASALESRGYQVVLPPDESHLDLLYAVGPGLQIEASGVHHFPSNGIRRVASRTGSDTYRHVGIQDLTVTTPQGTRVRLGQERLSPWIVEPVRRKQIKDLAATVEEKFPPDDAILLTINGGDMNHVTPLRKPDDKMWADQQGWEPVIEKGTPTHTSADKYRRSEKLFRVLGRRSSETQLDAAYARPRSGATLVNLGEAADSELSANEIGFSTRTLVVEGTDHYAVETTYSLPPRSQPIEEPEV